jgi:hypothetical protein
MMKRFIEMDEGQENSLTRKEFFRHAGERGLIDDFPEWVKFYQARNLTSHTYNEEIAEEVYVIAKEFEVYI